MGILKGSNENKALLPNEFLDKQGTMEKGCGVSDVVIWFWSVRYLNSMEKVEILNEEKCSKKKEKIMPIEMKVFVSVCSVEFESVIKQRCKGWVLVFCDYIIVKSWFGISR